MDNDLFLNFKNLFLEAYEAIITNPKAWNTTIPFLSSYLGLKTSYTREHIEKLRNILSCELRMAVCLAAKKAARKRLDVTSKGV